MHGMRKHIYRLHCNDSIFLRKYTQVARLCGRVTAYIYYFLGLCLQKHFAHIFMHACTRRIGNYCIRPSMFTQKIIVQQILYITGIEISIGYIIDLRIYFCIFDGSGYDATLVYNAGLWRALNVDGLDFTFSEATGALSVSAAAPVPEPATYALIAGAAALLGVIARRRLRPAKLV